MYWKIQHEWWMTRAALHESRVMHKIQYTMSAKHELCIGFYALQVMSAMQLKSWIMSVGFFNILSQKSLEWHYDIMIGMNNNNNFWRFFNETCVKFSWNSIKLLALARKSQDKCTCQDHIDTLICLNLFLTLFPSYMRNLSFF